jgi:ribosome-binding factor A
MAKKPTNPAGNPPSQRMLRVAEMIRHKLADMLMRGDIHDDTLAGHVITIPEVRITADLKLATVYVMPLGGEGADEVVKAFARNKSFIRSQVARTLNLKYAPDLRFKFDEMFDEAARIDALLDSPKVRADTRKRD